MKHMFIIIGIALATENASATVQQDAATTVTKALSCALGAGKAATVVSAAKNLGAKVSKDGTDFILPSPITVFGLSVTKLNITPTDGESPDSYIAIFPSANLREIAAATQLKSFAGGFHRDTKTGTLSADVRDKTDVWLVCTPTRPSPANSSWARTGRHPQK